MSDPLGLIGSLTSAGRIGGMGGMPPLAKQQGAGSVGGASFKEFLQQQIEQVNKLQTDADMAMEDLAAGRRDDVEGVIMATQKADIAFKMLLQVRNKVMDAYEEVKQIRI